MARNALRRQRQSLCEANEATTDDDYICLVFHTVLMPQQSAGFKGGF
jgi:hypothetical protein